MKIPAIILGLSVLGLPAAADEGMWLFNQFPTDKVRNKYGVDVSPKMLDHLRLSSVRVGASGSFVSANGLIFTNHHVVLGCVQNVSTPQNDYVANGFHAATLAEEKKCPGGEANVLIDIQDVSAKVKEAVKADPDSPDADRQRRAAMARLENECSSRTGGNCQAITLYGGAQYHLYQYKKYTDVRLVFAPEFQIGFFGGDPDNFTFPRYCLDIGFLRVYEDGKPARTPNFLRWSQDGVKEGEVVFVSGNPARTERLLTMAELDFYRQVAYPFNLRHYETAIAAVKAYMAQSAEAERVAKSTLFGLENTYKAMKGRYSGLEDERLMEAKRSAERELRAAVAKDASLRARYGQLWDQVAAAIKATSAGHVRRSLIATDPLGSRLFSIAREVLRLPEEMAKPEDQRLREFTGSALRSLTNRLFAGAPITPSLESAMLADHFRAMMHEFGAEDPLVKAVLDGKTAEAAAASYVAGTKLADVAERKRLSASVEAVRASTDSMIRLARILDPEARRLDKEVLERRDAVLNAAKPKLAEARFAIHGAGEPPDATFSLRLSYGRVRAYEDSRGKEIAYATRIGGVYARATGEAPYVLPRRWLDARSRLDPKTPFDFVSTADIIGGNSGSPTVNTNGEIVGIVFDGNIESLPNHFQFSETSARAVHVSSQVILEALTKIYHADRILEEMGAAAPAAVSSR